jgi:hypothetical protein
MSQYVENHRRQSNSPNEKRGRQTQFMPSFWLGLGLSNMMEADIIERDFLCVFSKGVDFLKQGVAASTHNQISILE